jgi:hypothetical protein
MKSWDHRITPHNGEAQLHCSGPNCMHWPEYQCSYNTENGWVNKYYCYTHAIRFALKFRLKMPRPGINLSVMSEAELGSLRARIDDILLKRKSSTSPESTRKASFEMVIAGTTDSPPYFARLYWKDGKINRFFFNLAKKIDGETVILSVDVSLRSGDVVEWRDVGSKHLGLVIRDKMVSLNNRPDLWRELSRYLSTWDSRILKPFIENGEEPDGKQARLHSHNN